VDFEVLGILFMTIVAPLWIIFHYTTVWKQQKTITGEDERILEDLFDGAERMEARLDAIERILDQDDANWRKEA